MECEEVEVEEVKEVKESERCLLSAGWMPWVHPLGGWKLCASA
jgi:hypothetical protein